MKPVTWQAYFNVRNGLIVKAFRAKNVRSAARGNLRGLLANFLNFVLTYQYFQAAMVLEAYSDFLDGPEVLMKPVRGRFDQLGQMSSEYPIFRSERSGQYLISPASPRIRGGRIGLLRAIYWNCFSRISEMPKERSFNTRFVGWRAFYGLEKVIIDDSDWAHAIVYDRNPVVAVRLFKRAILLMLRYYWQGSRAVLRWRERRDHVTSKTYWTEYLRMNEAAP